jgi:hypothetical protein
MVMAGRVSKVTVVPEETETEAVDNSGPIVVKSSGKARERVVLFTIDDEEFSVPAKPGVNVTLKFLNEMRKSGNDMFAALGLLEAMLGQEKYDKLLDYDELEDELLGRILEQVVKLAMDRVEETSGK